MDQQNLITALANLSGQIKTASGDEKEIVDKLYPQLANAISDGSTDDIKGITFSYETAFTHDLSESQQENFRKVAKRTLLKNTKPVNRVFVRDTPIRSGQLKTSTPDWAKGAAVSNTIGPFLSKDGRKLWYDFYKIEELIPLYIQGNPNPAVLFYTPVFQHFPPLQVVIDQEASYNLTGNSVWINAGLLANNAPSASYVGLSITGGSINVSKAPQLINGQLTIDASTLVSVRLQLNQPAITDSDPTSPYGKDARAATLILPTEFDFHFSGTEIMAIDLLADSQWNLYGNQATFTQNKEAPSFDNLLQEILIPLSCSNEKFSISNNLSTFNILSEGAVIQWSAWALPVAQIDITKPTTAEGIGSITIRCMTGISNRWAGLQGGAVSLSNPYIQLGVGKITVIDLSAINIFGSQDFQLWQEDQKQHRSTVELLFNKSFPLLYISDATGVELIAAQSNATFQIDRPVTIEGQPANIHSNSTLLLLIATKSDRFLYLYDDNILQNNFDPANPDFFAPISFALNNALFKVSPANGCSLFGDLASDFLHVAAGQLFITFGIFTYLPLLPDPYAANLGILKNQFTQQNNIYSTNINATQQIWLWLVCEVAWKRKTKNSDDVNVSFSFAPLQQNTLNYDSVLSFVEQKDLADKTRNSPDIMANLANYSFIKRFTSEQGTNVAGTPEATASPNIAYREAILDSGLPDYQSQWDNEMSFFENEMFALLDVSSSANQMGVSFNFSNLRDADRATSLKMFKTFGVETSALNDFPLQIQGMDVVSASKNVRLFALPQVSWEPVINLSTPTAVGDPPLFFNYYPDDGGATRLMNNSSLAVPIAPIPVTNSLVSLYKSDVGNMIAAYFTLSFGLRALAVLSKQDKNQQKTKPTIREIKPSFPDEIQGGIQLSLRGGSDDANPKVSNQFDGVTLQINNILDALGNKTNASTLGYDVTTIFNGEFFTLKGGVPLTRIDICGYGASTFSDWQDKSAEFATTSKAEFEIMLGRTAHEVIQVRSLIYPYGIRVVRTITLTRAASGYEFRYDSGWKAESDGQFDFTFHVAPSTTPTSVYEIHPGVIKEILNVKNIAPAQDIQNFTSQMDINNFYYFDANTKTIKTYSAGSLMENINLEPVYFDADIEIENVVQGHASGKVSSKGMLGFVQLLPIGIPLTPTAFQQLLAYQNGSIGGPVNCTVDIGLNSQLMRVHRVDVNNSFDASGANPVFVGAIRGNVTMPKEGSWGMVTHQANTGEITAIPKGTTVPLIRIGALDANLNYPVDGLLRIANPTELLRSPGANAINFGFLQTTHMEKALFLTPAYQNFANSTPGKLLSRTPPLFADAYHLMNCTGLFPNVADALTSFGNAIPLENNFNQNALKDAGTNVLELMQINLNDGVEGYKLLKQTEFFNLPDNDCTMADGGSLFQVYVEYKATINGTNRPGTLNYDVDSFSANNEDKWISKLSNLAMVVDLGPFSRIVTIKGDFDSQNGSPAVFEGDPNDPTFNAPQVELSSALQTAMEILEILSELQGPPYSNAMKQGMQMAMSSNANGWQFTASQEIPLLKFPFPDLGPDAPLKIEASLKLGVYFKQTFKVGNDPKQLIPTIGAYLEFYGGISVMCVSLAVGTIYAVGQATLKIAADTKIGPSLDMKFGFGAQIVVGLPVVGNVSVLYMIGVGIDLSSTAISVTASMLFKGNADLLDGLINITITIEAQGTITHNYTPSKTSCKVEVTFALDISLFLVIDIDFSTSWSEQRQIS